MLDKKLYDYSKLNIYPFHMPGHKRLINEMDNPYLIDITEIDGFDNLHHATEILDEAQKRGARLYNSKECYFLINGSTCGILSAISAATDKGDKVIVARNCHKAVYHGIFLKELCPVYVYPKIADCGIQGQITSDMLKTAIENNQDAKAVIITSPTYDGVVSDIEKITRIAHKYGMTVIVDQAHGAHFGFSKDMPKSAIECGADIVIVSIHKTLPAFTQTALLHQCSDRVDSRKLRKYLGIYETSSPSYVLMAGIEYCLRYIDEKKETVFEEFEHKREEFFSRVEKLKNLKVLRREDFSAEEAFDFDESKLLIFTDKSSITGKELYDILLEKYKLQMEMVSGDYVVGISTILDSTEGFDRLANALIEIDENVLAKESASRGYFTDIYSPLERKLEIYQAEEMEQLEIDLEEASGKVSGDYINLYPPGIPIVVPGEIISDKCIKDLKAAIEADLEIIGIKDGKRINIVNFS